jgi:DNA replication and repair protein RecF
LLAEISCRSFRNLETTSWRPGSGCHLIMGPNGAGKTSDCARHGGAEFHLEGEVEGERRVSLQIGLGETGRYRKLNGSICGLIDHLRVLPVVAWTEEDREILNGPPARRRRFVDQGIVGTRPVALECLARFRRILLQKRELLATQGGGLRSWNEVLAASAAELMSLRGRYISDLAKALEAVIARTGIDLPEIGLEYRPSIQVSGNDPAAILEVLQRAEAGERREGRPIVGPQRDEVRIAWSRRGVRRNASAGERKALGYC